MIPGIVASARSVVAVGGSNISFNPATKHAAVTLSGGNKIASTESASGHYGAMCNGAKSAGKWVYEMTVENLPSSGNLGFGVARSLFDSPSSGTATPAVYGGAYWGRQKTPLVRTYDGSNADNVSPSTDKIPLEGDVITVTIDFSTLEMAFYRNGIFVAARVIASIDPTTYTFCPIAKLWGATGDAATVSINSSILYPVAGFSPWTT